MAIEQNTTSKPSMVHEEYHWGNYYHGTKDELVGTGLFKPEWFPGAKGNLKTSMTYKGKAFRSLLGIAPEFSELHIYRKDSTRKRFTIRVTVSEDEQERRAMNADNERAMELAKSWLAGLSDSPDRYKRKAANMLTSFAKIICDGGAKEGGYCLMDESKTKVEQAIKMMNDAIMGAEVLYSADKHEKYRQELVKEAFERHNGTIFIEGTERNERLQRFMAELLAPAGSAAEAAHI